MLHVFLYLLFVLGFPSDGYFLCTARLIPEGFGALWAYARAAFALLRVFMGNDPLGAPPEGPAKDLTPLYFPTFEPPGFFRIAASLPGAIDFVALFLAISLSLSRWIFFFAF